MDLIVTEGYWIKFCVKLLAVIYHDTYNSQYYDYYQHRMVYMDQAQPMWKLGQELKMLKIDTLDS
jgi:hypothetical protein